VVTLVDRAFGGIDTSTAVLYVIVQVAGAIVGAMVANAMFGLPLVEWSTTERSGGDLWFAEGIATLGLLVVIFGVVRSGRASLAAIAVAGYIAGAYYFTSSTSFANPAATIGRALPAPPKLAHPGRDDRPCLQRHVRGHRAGGRPDVRRRPAGRRRGRHRPDPGALPPGRRRGGGRGRPSPGGAASLTRTDHAVARASEATPPPKAARTAARVSGRSGNHAHVP